MKIKIKDYTYLNELIVKKGFNKTDFSKQIPLSQPMTIQICNGDRNPSPRTAKRISEVLEVNFDDVFVIEKSHKKKCKEERINGEK
ncbi:helix-turn-helix transcriptional regulator [Brevibacillus sp. RS1.1]|uniref:helix-turn-helix transcriptional regulator n=1 Tax=Brevibacillus sp. RS1.1 TaxID=2738982 RepID=UPI00156AE73A|nr:helix-turn-helix transcriptional regulator [Brevibacillus sp. RS1.1]NRR04564.1 helix-turn-helix transcriptional regulator [Brevibacillus sp. RS1.1]